MAIGLATQSAWQGVLATAPTVSAIADQTTPEDTPTAAIAVTVGDAETPPVSLVVTASSSDAAILAPSGIALGGAGANRTLTLTPVAGASGGPVTVTVDVSDGILVTSTTFQLMVTAVNDAPAGTDKTVTIIEDTPYTFTTADFGYSDGNDVPANPFQAVTFTTLPAAGTLTNNGVAVGVGASVSAADIAAGRLVYTPALNGNGVAYAAFTFQVQDDGGTANGGADLDPVANTCTFNVSPVNDAAPVNTVAAAQTTDEDKALQIRRPRHRHHGVRCGRRYPHHDGLDEQRHVVCAARSQHTITGNRTSTITISGIGGGHQRRSRWHALHQRGRLQRQRDAHRDHQRRGSLSGSDSITVAVPRWPTSSRRGQHQGEHAGDHRRAGQRHLRRTRRDDHPGERQRDHGRGRGDAGDQRQRGTGRASWSSRPRRASSARRLPSPTR